MATVSGLVAIDTAKITQPRGALMSNDDDMASFESLDEITDRFKQMEEIRDRAANDEWVAYDPETKSTRALSPDELFDVAAKVEATQPSDWVQTSPGVYQATRDMDPIEAMDSMRKHHVDTLNRYAAEARVINVPNEATATPIAPAATAATSTARLAQ